MRWAQNGSSQSLPSRRANTLRPIQKEPAQSRDIKSVNAVTLVPINAGVLPRHESEVHLSIGK